jgi:3'-phosphoadenosine 5'-phosphosulfate sulfotransferase (PAPS reductase)/FAD synthetase
LQANAEELKYLQELPLTEKIRISSLRIQEWYEYWQGKVSISFSGGRDSTVLKHLVHKLYPEVPIVFIDTGLEFPEIKQFVKQQDNVIILKPKMTYRQVLDKYGYPVISKETANKIYEIRTTKSIKLLNKRLNGNNTPWKSGKLPEKWKYLIDAPFKISSKCCDIMKKQPAAKYSKTSGHKWILGVKAKDSRYRFQSYIRYGCNAFDLKEPSSRPIIFWTKKDILEYIKTYDVAYCKIYDMGYDRTGCIFCGFGANRETAGNHRFVRLRQTHPKLYKYCMDESGLGLRKVMMYCKVPI